MDPQTRAYLANMMLERRRPPVQNPWGNAFSGLANILAQRNLGKANQDILRNQELDEETDRNRLALGYVGLGMDPQMGEYLADAPPEIQKILVQRHMQNQVSPEQIMALYPDVTPKQAQAFVNLPANMQQQVGAMFISQNEPEEKKTTLKQLNFVEDGVKYTQMAVIDNATGQPVSKGEKTKIGKVTESAMDKYFQGLNKERLAQAEVEASEKGGSKLTPAHETAIQKNLVVLEKMDGMIGAIDLEKVEKHLDWPGRGTDKIAWVSDMAALPGWLFPSVDEWEKDRLGARQKLFNNVGQIFADYRRQVTGAAASMAELGRLEKIFINEQMSPDQFFGALGQLQDFVKRETKTNFGYIQEGIVPKDFTRPESEESNPFMGMTPEQRMEAFRSQSSGG